jgi:peptidase YpeB-like protein
MEFPSGRLCAGVVAVTMLLTGGSAVALAKAKISRKRAEAIALERQPGTVAEGELEREHGRLVYSFDIRTADTGIVEVQVDAYSGKVVSVEHETAEHEAAEKKAETKKRP